MSDYEWLAELHKKHYNQLMCMAHSRLRATSTAVIDPEDIVQQAFLLAAMKPIDTHEEPLWWLMKTVDNLCKHTRFAAFNDSRKVQRIIQQRMDYSADRSIYAVEQQEPDTGECEAMLLMEQVLTAEEWTLLSQYCLSGESAEALAEQYNLSPAALRVRIFRLRKKLHTEYYGD
ncbi:MAG: sigma-70 family RNA polymerase sigma factor [Clostridia bacterium]|nr:sigma-70 family RNA polymerase sigma factor [Clostridia bacterium]